MLMGRGFPQHHHFSMLYIVGSELGRTETGRRFQPYPHLGITLWIMQITSGEGFSRIVLSFYCKFNRLDEEAPCG